MKKKLIFFVFILPGALTLCSGGKKMDNNGKFKLSSTSVVDAKQMNIKYASAGCKGQDVSPQLQWSGAPEGTKSYVVTMHDPDAPTGSGWWHWVLFDIPKTITSIEEGRSANLEQIKTVRNDGGVANYGGPCPPAGHGVHHYNITVYALSVDSLGLDPKTATPAMVGFYTWMHTIAKTTMTPIYEIKK